MIKKYSIITMFSLFAAGSLIFPMSSVAEDFATDSPGEKFDFPTTTDFSFQPSPQVTIDGTSDGEAFVVAAAHGGSFDKKNGNAYLMHSETSGVFFISLDGLDTIPALPTLADEVTNGSIGTAGWQLEGASG